MTSLRITFVNLRQKRPAFLCCYSKPIFLGFPEGCSVGIREGVSRTLHNARTAGCFRGLTPRARSADPKLIGSWKIHECNALQTERAFAKPRFETAFRTIRAPACLLQPPTCSIDVIADGPPRRFNRLLRCLDLSLIAIRPVAPISHLLSQSPHVTYYRRRRS